MATPTVPDLEILKSIEKIGVTATAKKYNLNATSLHKRRRNLEKRYHQQITPPEELRKHGSQRHHVRHPARQEVEVKNGHVIIFSDCHYWPGEKSTAHRALVKLLKEFSPELLIANGDVVDMAQVSRHPPIGWETCPSVVDEVETAQERLHEIAMACPKRTRKIWNLGNHDGRYETRLAQCAPEYAKMHGVHLRDHFPVWEPAWSTWINDNVVVKHRWKGGVNAPRNNTIFAGKSIVTGHLHSAKVEPFTDYNGDRYGVDTGCISNIFGGQFTDYTEDNPRDWRSGFGVLTFLNHELLMPELVLVWDADHVQFRGKIINV